MCDLETFGHRLQKRRKATGGNPELTLRPEPGRAVKLANHANRRTSGPGLEISVPRKLNPNLSRPAQIQVFIGSRPTCVWGESLNPGRS